MPQVALMIPQGTIAHYRITAKLGEGGMGEVWRATDTKLGREVALKVLPASFAQDPERMARFEREAKVLASLNHPNIAAIYGVEERALVMELVEGQTLKGPLPLETVLDYGRQIADGLEAAHEKGIVHRDLKPGNIMVTPAGVIKVLDFGLAKAAEEPSSDSQNSPTQTISPTRLGTILGTAPYMAPEQARGKPMDKRVDIWAFGCVLYEMLTGEPAFTGETTTDILAAVVTKEPDLTRTPVKVRRLLRRCLEKDPKKRLRDVGDAWELLEVSEAPIAAGRSQASWIVAAVLAIGLAVTGAVLWRATRPVDHPLTRFSVDLGPEALAGVNLTAAISPDGRRLVFPARGPDGRQVLATRMLDQAQSTLLQGTENGRDPFFKPDGQWIGFFVRNQLKKISVQGGTSVTLGSGQSPFGASWAEDGTIISAFGGASPLSQIPEAGGTPRLLTKLGAGEGTHRWPQVLPGGDAVLFTVAASVTGMENADIEAFSLKTRQVKIVHHGGYYGRYLPSGHLVYVHQGVLFGVKFNAERLEVSGSPVPLLDDNVAGNPVAGGGQFDFSGTATFVYAAGKSATQGWRLAWLDSSGKMQSLMTTPGAYSVPRFSPDGRKVALIGNGDVYVYDLARDTATQLTFKLTASAPVWAPDGRHIAFRSAADLFWTRSDGAGDPQRLLERPTLSAAWSFSADGRWLAYFERDPETGFDIWTLPLDVTDPDHPKPGKPEPFVLTAANELCPRFSADGRWIAYRSDESGTQEIYVRPFPAASGGKWKISTGGGLWALWSNNGRELYYETIENRIMVLNYTVEGASFVPGKPRLWADQRLFSTESSNLDLAPDGKRFIVFSPAESAPSEKGSVHMTVLENFFDELREKVAMTPQESIAHYRITTKLGEGGKESRVARQDPDRDGRRNRAASSTWDQGVPLRELGVMRQVGSDHGNLLRFGGFTRGGESAR